MLLKVKAPTGRGLLLPLILAATLAGAIATTAKASPENDTRAPGRLSISEYKKTGNIEVNVSQSKLFLIKNKIIRTSVADPGIAEPVVLAENVFILLGKNPGETTVQIWDDAGGNGLLSVLVEPNPGPHMPLFRSRALEFIEDICGPDRHLNTPVKHGRFALKPCSDPGETKESEVKDGCAENLKVLSRILADRHKLESTNQIPESKPAAVSAKAPSMPGKPHEDTLSVDGGKEIVIASGIGTGPTTRTLNLTVSQSRTFKSKNTLAKLITTDPSIAEPIVLSRDEFILLGKAPGKTTLAVQDEIGNTLAVDLNVRKQTGRLLSLVRQIGELVTKLLHGQQNLSPIAPVAFTPIEFCEQRAIRAIGLKPYQPSFFNTGHGLLRAAIADPGCAEPVLLTSTKLALVGKRPGRTTIFLWDDAGNIGAFELVVADKAFPAKQSSQPEAAETSKSPGSTAVQSKQECEIWSGSRKDVVSLANDDSNNCENPNPATVKIDYLVNLNNEGVQAIVRRDYRLAFEKLEKALKLKPGYRKAQENLAIACNNFGLSLQSEPDKAIAYFHSANYLDPNNPMSKANLEGIIRKLGREPDNFQDRVDLDDQALSRHDINGGIVEYKAALALRDDRAVRTKLARAVKLEATTDRHESSPAQPSR